LNRLQSLLESCAEEINMGAVVIVSDERYRIRRLPI